MDSVVLSGGNENLRRYAANLARNLGENPRAQLEALETLWKEEGSYVCFKWAMNRLYAGEYSWALSIVITDQDKFGMRLAENPVHSWFRHMTRDES